MLRSIIYLSFAGKAKRGDVSDCAVIYKWQSSLSEKAVWARKLGHVINGLFGALVNNYGCIGFLVRRLA